MGGFFIFHCVVPQDRSFWSSFTGRKLGKNCELGFSFIFAKNLALSLIFGMFNGCVEFGNDTGGWRFKTTPKLLVYVSKGWQDSTFKFLKILYILVIALPKLSSYFPEKITLLGLTAISLYVNNVWTPVTCKNNSHSFVLLCLCHRLLKTGKVFKLNHFNWNRIFLFLDDFIKTIRPEDCFGNVLAANEPQNVTGFSFYFVSILRSSKL